MSRFLLSLSFGDCLCLVVDRFMWLVVCWLLFVAGCGLSIFVGSCLLVVVCWLEFVACCVLRRVGQLFVMLVVVSCWSLFVVSCVGDCWSLIVDCCLLFVACGSVFDLRWLSFVV